MKKYRLFEIDGMVLTKMKSKEGMLTKAHICHTLNIFSYTFLSKC